MQINGTYGFVYAGEDGIGFGVFTLKDGVLSGYDSGDTRYKGTVNVDTSTSEVVFNFEQELPGTSLFVQGGGQLGFTSKWAREKRLPANFANGKPHEIELAPGIVNVMFKQIPDGWAQLASGFSIKPN